MTSADPALPATREDCLAFIAQLTADGSRSVYASIAVWDTLLALARLGAATVGAMEATAVATLHLQLVGTTNKLFSVKPGARCLILPPEPTNE